MTFSIMTLETVMLSALYAECHLSSTSQISPIVLSVIMLSVVMLYVVTLNVVARTGALVTKKKDIITLGPGPLCQRASG